MLFQGDSCVINQSINQSSLTPQRGAPDDTVPGIWARAAEAGRGGCGCAQRAVMGRCAIQYCDPSTVFNLSL